MRPCGTPGCTYKDFHTGCCSTELLLPKRRRTEDFAPMSPHNVCSTNEGNQFQHGIRLSVRFPSHMRPCGTPGCTYKDFHTGCCSTELLLQKQRRTEDFAPMSSTHNITKEGNQFQHGIRFVQACMKDQIGVVLELPGDLHPTIHIEESFKATVIETLSDNTYVASVSTADSFTFSLRPVDLVRYDVCAPWKKLKTYMMTEHNAALIGKEHDASARRMHCFVDTLSGIYTTTSDQIVLSLDGIGSNRETFADKFRDLSTHMIPQFLTYEIDPAVALSTALVWETCRHLHRCHGKGKVWLWL